MQNYGWDLVHACQADFINSQMAAAPQEFIAGFFYNDSNVEIMNGQLSNWQLVGGNGQLLRFSVTVQSGELYFPNLGMLPSIYRPGIDLSGLTLLFELQLRLLSTPNNGLSLVFNCQVPGSQPGDTTPGAVTLVSPDVNGNINSVLAPLGINLTQGAQQLHNALQNVIIQNAHFLSFCFASLQSSYPTPPFGSFAYCYQASTTGGLGGIALLGTLNSSSLPSLQKTFDTTLLTTNTIGIVTSYACTLGFLAPVLANSFGGGCSATLFEVNYTSSTIYSCQSFNANNLNSIAFRTITPTINTTCFQLYNGQLIGTVTATVPITGFSNASINSTSSSCNSCYYNNNGTFGFLTDTNASQSNSKNIPWYDYMLGAMPISGAIENEIPNYANNIGTSINIDFAQHFGTLVQWCNQSNISIVAGGAGTSLYLQANIV
jgi:hypothetical protein